jgi:hypothetical protein
LFANPRGTRRHGDRPDETGAVELPRSRADYERGLPDHHDPTAGIGGAAPAQSALTLRAVLAIFGLVFCAGAAWFAFSAHLPVIGWVASAIAVIALVDLAVVLNRKRRGEPG